MRRKNEFLTTGVYSHIFKHNSIQILVKLDDFFRKTYLGKNSVLYWYIKWSSYGVDPGIKIVGLLMLIHMSVIGIPLRSKAFESIQHNSFQDISDGGSVLFLPIPIQGSLVRPIPIPNRYLAQKIKYILQFIVKVMRFISYNITFDL